MKDVIEARKAACQELIAELEAKFKRALDSKEKGLIEVGFSAGATFGFETVTEELNRGTERLRRESS